MKPFNLEQAKLGKPVCTRDGKDVVIYEFNLNGKDRIAGKVCDSKNVDTVTSWGESGAFYENRESSFDLFMKSETKTGWVNLLKSRGTRHTVHRQ